MMRGYDMREMLGSCKSCSKLSRVIAEKYGIAATRDSSESLSRAVQDQLENAVRNECRLAVEEAACRIFRVFHEHVREQLPDGVYIPATEIWVNEGKVGTVKLRPFRSQ